MNKNSDRIVVVSKRNNFHESDDFDRDDDFNDNDYESYDRWSKGNDRKVKVLKFKENRSRWINKLKGHYDPLIIGF